MKIAVMGTGSWGTALAQVLAIITMKYFYMVLIPRK